MNLVPYPSKLDGRTHRENIMLLRAAVQATTWGEMVSYAGAVFDGDEINVKLDASNVQSKTWMIHDQTNNQVLIIITGMNAWVQAPACLLSWNTDDAESPNANCYETAARSILLSLAAYAILPGTLVRIVGHSYGGATALWLAAKLWDAGVVTQTTWTYGGPKSGYARSFLRQLADSVCRVLLRDDPVGALPISWDQLSNLWALTGVPTARRWSRWGHSITGFELANGELTAVPGSTRVGGAGSGGIHFTLLGWVTGISAFGADRHTLAAYADGVSGIGNVTYPQAQAHTTYHPLEPVLGTAVQMESARGVAIATQAINTAINPNGVAGEIQAAIVRVPGVRFRGRMRDGVPAIYYGDQFVTYARTRRVRRAMVKYLNRSVVAFQQIS